MALVLGFLSCKGDLGPAGPIGPTGETGSVGSTGEQGWGTQDCAKCHTSQIIAAKQFQWEHSVHATGGHFTHNAASCAPCHTSQGFLEALESGSTSTAATVHDPLPQNCYTCHQIHRTFTEEDWALTQTDPVNFRVGGMADVGKGNLCITCHQARTTSPAVPDPSNPPASVVLTAAQNRFGPHHGAQGMLFTGTAGYELEGPEAYKNSVHTNAVKNSCVTCHMATANGVTSGGHTFRVADSETGAINTAGCVQCHSDVAGLNTKISNTQNEIASLLGNLKTKLIDKGLLDGNTDLAVPGEFKGHELGAFYNYKYISEDKSFGVHNYKYAKALLVNSIAALQ